jgi:tetratricopeptide (TPR) repeat protein
LRLALDGVLAPRDGTQPLGLAGIELMPASHLSVRGGYQLGGPNDPSGFTVGAGLGGLGPFALDYAYNAVGALGATQQVSLRVDFGADGSAALTPPDESQAAPAKTALEAQVAAFVQQLKTKNYPAASTQGQALQQSAPDAAKQVLSEARVDVVKPAVFEGRYEEVESVLRSMQSLDPKDAYVEEALGMMDWHQGRFDSARVHYRKAADLDPTLEYLVRWSKETGPQP